MSQTSSSSGQFAYLEQVVTADQRNGDIHIRYPVTLQNNVSTSIKTKPGIHWNIDTEFRCPIISDSSLREESYTHVGGTKIYDDGYIRPPNSGDAKINLQNYFKAYERLFYVATEEMLAESGVSSVHIVTDDTLTELLGSSEDTRVSSLRTAPNYTV